MLNKAGQRRALFTLMSLFFLMPPLVLLYIGFTTFQQLDQLDRNLGRLVKSHEVALNLNHLTTSVQEYIFYSNLQALNDFRHYGRQAVDRELELHNLVGQSEKQSVEELIALTKNYLSFMEKEVVPARKEGLPGPEREMMPRQCLDLTRQLVYRADSLLEAGRTEAQKKMGQTMADARKTGIFARLLSLLSLGALFGAAILVLPWLVRNHLFASAIAGFPNAVMIVDRQERLQYINQAAQDLFCLPKDIAAGKNLKELLRIFPHLQPVVQPLYPVLLHKEKLLDCRTTYLRGEDKLSLSIDYLPAYISRWLAGIILLCREGRKENNGMVLLDAIESERKRISIEIHDWIGRYMSSIIHGLDYVLRVKEEQLPPEVKENILMLRTQCQKAAIEMRSIMNDIHPYLIEKAGLIAALESYADSFERIHNIKVYIYYQNRSLPLTPEEQITIYRIIQEALTNVAKHSPATEVDIYFNETGDSLLIEIIDNGGVQEAPPVPGKGLWGMKERARSIGGKMLHSYRDGGFCVSLNLPKRGRAQSGQDQDYAGGGSQCFPRGLEKTH